MAEAGESSPHLDNKERRQAAAGAPMGALVIHEIVRDQGEEELERFFSGLAWSGIAAGLSSGFRSWRKRRCRRGCRIRRGACWSPGLAIPSAS
jgi:hypothetical protein